jgi:hypothetical protein
MADALTVTDESLQFDALNLCGDILHTHLIVTQAELLAAILLYI